MAGLLARGQNFVVAGSMLVGQSGPFVGPFLESCLLCAPRVRQNGILRDVLYPRRTGSRGYGR